jgi:hypothetical protein
LSEKTTTVRCSLSSFFVLFMCTQRRGWRTDVSVCHRLILFCLCAPKKNVDKSTFIVILICFVFVHLKNMMTSWRSLFVLFYFILKWLLRGNMHERHERCQI